MNLQETAKNMPLSPGVYIWLDKNNTPLYVGRATSLRRRVLQYFRKDVDARIGEMVSLAKKIKYYETDTVLEAVILEANLIKKYWPKYNVKDRDNRSFVYIVFPRTSPRLRTASSTDFPKPIIVRGRELQQFTNLSVIASRSEAIPLDGSANKGIAASPLAPRNDKAPTVFGPYQSLTLVRNALKVIRRIFPYSTCGGLQTSDFRLQSRTDNRRRKSDSRSPKPCFDYQIGLCPGVCVGKISKQDYQKNINNIILLLKGEKKKLLKKLTKENPTVASALKHIQDVTLIAREEFADGGQKFNRIEGYDISHFAGKEVYGSMVVFTDGRPDKNQYRLFKIKTVGNNDLDALKEMMERRLKHTEWPRPDLILIDGGKPQVDYIFKIIEQQQLSTPLLGISKLNGDRLVYPAGTKNVFKDLAETIKRTLQQARDEAHRFANRGRKLGMKIR